MAFMVHIFHGNADPALAAPAFYLGKACIHGFYSPLVQINIGDKSIIISHKKIPPSRHTAATPACGRHIPGQPQELQQPSRLNCCIQKFYIVYCMT